MMGLSYMPNPSSSIPLSSVIFVSPSCERSRPSPQEKGLLHAPHPLSHQELILLKLLKAHLITLPPPTHNKFPKYHSFCAYHQVLGHSTSECKAFSDKIQQHQSGVIIYSSIDVPSSSLHNK